MHQSIDFCFTSNRFFAWDPNLISPPQKEKKKPWNANFVFYVRHIHDWRNRARWKKRHSKCESRILFSAIPKNMPLLGKERAEIVKVYYLNGQNATQALRVYRRNRGLRRGPCTLTAVWDLIHKFEKTGCTCYRPRFGRCGNCWRNSSDDKHSSSRKCMRRFTCSASAKFNCP